MCCFFQLIGIWVWNVYVVSLLLIRALNPRAVSAPAGLGAMGPVDPSEWYWQPQMACHMCESRGMEADIPCRCSNNKKTQWILVTPLGFHDFVHFKSEWQAKTYRKISCLSIKNDKRPFKLMEILAVCFLHPIPPVSKAKIPTSLQKAG